MSVIFCPTVQHSGTWFLLDLFKTNPKIHVSEMGFVLYTDKKMAINKINMVHTHVSMGHVVEKLAKQRGKHYDRLGHQYYSHWNDELSWVMGRAFPTVMPVRDPLASIISLHRRHPDLKPHTWIVDSWLKIANIEGLWEPFFVPVDLKMTDKERLVLLSNMVGHCGLDPWPEVNRWAIEWPVRNKTGVKPYMLDKYKQRDADYLAYYFPEEWKALKESPLRPFFEKLGYKGMLWW